MSTQETGHLEQCRTCADSLSDLCTVIGVARDAEPVRELPAMPGDLWQRISQEVFAQPPTVLEVAPGSDRPGRRRQGRTAWRAALLAVAAALVGIAGTLGVQTLVERPPTIVAEASLGSKNAVTRAVRGTVTIVDTGHGLQMKVDVSDMPSTTGYYAVWLYDGADTMIPLGTLGPAPLNLPASVSDLERFPLVDISAQQLGQQAHGVSLLQGALRTE
ncbi:anti-sigma factor [Kineosporia mesophila]|nr:anti-sigma factor [Kineosporia mesophila]MCD5352021.1 anti-sigma factor [Kineosporia mesophila]